MTQRILLVEDDEDLARIVVDTAALLQLAVTHVSDGREGLERALQEKYDLVLLDIALPSVNGFDICRELRTARPLLPIVFLTAQRSEVDVALGLEFGADDYILKPFRPRELVSRLRSILARYQRLLAASSATSSAHQSERTVRFGDVIADFDALNCSKGGAPVSLTSQEWLLLEFLTAHTGRTLSRDTIIEAVWGAYDSSFDGLLSRLVHRLRKKVEDDPENPVHVKSVRGIGYRLE